MKSIKSLIAIALVSSALVSCEKDDKFPFTDVPRVQFGPEQSRFYDPNANLADTLKGYSFVYAGTKTIDTVYFDLYATGGVSFRDRSFTLKQVEVAGVNVNNAVADQHYRAFDNELLKSKYIVKAGQVHTRVPIVLLRTLDLKTKDITLKFEVQENENFKLGEKANLWRKLTIADRLTKTPQWDIPTVKNTWLGNWSAVKHQWFIDKTGQPWTEAWMKNLIETDSSQMAFWVAMARNAWIEYNKVNPPLKDENGIVISFPL